MFEISKNVAIPDRVRAGINSRIKYPFESMKLVDPKTMKGDCLEIDGEEDAKRALVRMRGFARDHNAEFLHEKIKKDGKLTGVRIWRTK